MAIGDSADVSIEDNTIVCALSYDQWGILLWNGSRRVQIRRYARGNNIRGCEVGMGISNSKDVKIFGNTVTDARAPVGAFSSSTLIWIKDSQDVAVTKNYFKNADYGIQAKNLSGAGSQYVDNRFCRVNYYFVTQRILNATPQILVQGNRDVCGGGIPPENIPTEFPE